MLPEMIDFLEEKIQEWHVMFAGYGNEETEAYQRYVSEVNAYQEIIDYLKGQLLA